MTNKQLKELKSLFRRLNEKNKCHNRKYVCRVDKFAYNAYCMDVEFTLMFSTDHEEIMRYVLKNHLLCVVSGRGNGIAYMDIQ